MFSASASLLNHSLLHERPGSYGQALPHSLPGGTSHFGVLRRLRHVAVWYF